MTSDKPLRSWLNTSWITLTEAQLYDHSKQCEAGQRKSSAGGESVVAQPLGRRVSTYVGRKRSASVSSRMSIGSTKE